MYLLLNEWRREHRFVWNLRNCVFSCFLQLASLLKDCVSGLVSGMRHREWTLGDTVHVNISERMENPKPPWKVLSNVIFECIIPACKWKVSFCMYYVHSSLYCANPKWMLINDVITNAMRINFMDINEQVFGLLPSERAGCSRRAINAIVIAS